MSEKKDVAYYEKILEQYSIKGSAEELALTEFAFLKEKMEKHNNKTKIAYEKLSDEEARKAEELFLKLISKWYEIFSKENLLSENYYNIDFDEAKDITSYTYYYTTKEMGNYIRCEILSITDTTMLVVEEMFKSTPQKAIFAGDKKLSYPFSIFASIYPKYYSTFCEFREKYKNFEI